MKSVIIPAAHAGAAASLVLTPIAVPAKSASNLGDLVGARTSGGAALLTALLSHKPGHPENGQHHDDSRKEDDYERGYRDGMHDSAYRNNARQTG